MSKLDRKPIESEYTLESWLHSNPSVLLNEPLFLFGRQTGLDTGIPDLLALDQWANVVVFELKKGESGSGSASEATIQSQPQNYAQSLSAFGYDDLNEVYQEYRTQIQQGEWDVDESMASEETLKGAFKTIIGPAPDRTDFNTHQRIVIVAEEITSRTENNAKYLLEQGLDVQCVEVQWFQVPDDAPVEQDHSLLVSSSVVDYPLSRVRPERSSADYSKLTEAIRDRVAARVRDREGIEGVRATPTQVKVESAYPSGLRYEVYVPGNEAGRQATIRMNAGDVASEDVEAIRSVLIDHLDEQGPYRVEDEQVMNIVSREEPVTIGEGDIDAIEEITMELVFLVERYQPHLVDEFNRVR
jgi:hypothetical protein